MEKDHLKDTGDALSALVAFGTLADLLPAIASVLAIVWTLVRLYEWGRIRLCGKDPKSSAN